MPYRLPKPVLLTESVGGERLYWSRQDMVFKSHKGAEIIIPAGFLSDGLSIPKVFRGIFPQSPSWMACGQLHDYGYRKDFPHDMTRKEVDLLFLYYMKMYGVGWLTRHTIYRAVRLGAMKNWKARNAVYHK
jgi:hypothetical protein